MSKKVIVTNPDGSEKEMYLQEKGNCVSKVSSNPNGGWKTEKTTFNSFIKDAETGKPLERPLDEIMKDI